MVYIKKNDSKIKYLCPHCSKDFNNRKSDYNRHINKKNGCINDSLNNENNDINVVK